MGFQRIARRQLLGDLHRQFLLKPALHIDAGQLEADGRPVPIDLAKFVLVGPSNRRLAVKRFQHLMRAALTDAGLGADCTTHGTRYTAATILHELGCDDEHIQAIVGHRTAQMVRRYTAKKRRARIAISRLDDARRKQRGE
jgi:integrase